MQSDSGQRGCPQGERQGRVVQTPETGSKLTYLREYRTSVFLISWQKIFNLYSIPLSLFYFHSKLKMLPVPNCRALVQDCISVDPET